MKGILKYAVYNFKKVVNSFKIYKTAAVLHDIFMSII